MTSKSTGAPCPFCNPSDERVFVQNELAFAIWDCYPVSPGHTLIIPRQHISSWFDANDAERTALFTAVNAAKAVIDERHQPAGYNIGMNCGAVAGQTIFHAHIHLIPRFTGDVPDPRGGVRHVIPAKANYALETGAGSSTPNGQVK